MVMEMEKILILGGARSGKSSFALKLAETRLRRPLYVTTDKAFDKKMQAHIAAHKKARSRRWACALCGRMSAVERVISPAGRP